MYLVFGMITSSIFDTNVNGFKYPCTRINIHLAYKKKSMILKKMRD